MRALGVACDPVFTKAPGDATTIARTRAREYDLVFTLGGDGTAMEVISALAPDGPPVGVLPAGTGNLLARALGIPLRLRRAIPALLAGSPVRIDLGRLASGHRFAIGVGVGVDATMIAETPTLWKQRIGVAAYVVAGARAVLRQDRFTVRVTVDGVSLERQATAVLVANLGVLLNGLITLGEGIQHDDGVLNVCLFDPTSFPDAVRVMRKLVFRDFRPDPAMAYLTGRRIEVATDPPRVAQADGEIIGTTPFSVVTEPLAGCIIVPHRHVARQFMTPSQ